MVRSDIEDGEGRENAAALLIEAFFVVHQCSRGLQPAVCGAKGSPQQGGKTGHSSLAFRFWMESRAGAAQLKKAWGGIDSPPVMHECNEQYRLRATREEGPHGTEWLTW